MTEFLSRPRKYLKSKYDNRRGENHHSWKGGKSKHTEGYISILKPEHPFCDKRGYILEHRLVMENHIGRYLEPNEIVHHINGIKTDNRIENLQLTTRAEHIISHHISQHSNRHTPRDPLTGRFVKW